MAKKKKDYLTEEEYEARRRRSAAATGGDGSTYTTGGKATTSYEDYKNYVNSQENEEYWEEHSGTYEPGYGSDPAVAARKNSYTIKNSRLHNSNPRSKYAEDSDFTRSVRAKKAKEAQEKLEKKRESKETKFGIEFNDRTDEGPRNSQGQTFGEWIRWIKETGNTPEGLPELVSDEEIYSQEVSKLVTDASNWLEQDFTDRHNVESNYARYSREIEQQLEAGRKFAEKYKNDDQMRTAFEDTTKVLMSLQNSLNYAANTREATLADMVGGSRLQGYYQKRLGEELNKQMMGQENEVEKYAEILASDRFNFDTDSFIKRAFIGAGNLVGQIGGTIVDPNTWALVATDAAAGGLIGTAVPGIGTIGGAITGGGAGFVQSMTENAYEMESGFAYQEMIDNGIDPDTARKIAIGVGGINAALEMVQADTLVDAFKIVKGSGRKTVASKIAQELSRRGLDVGKETMQEVAQEATTIIGSQAASKIQNDEWQYSADEVKDRLKDTALQSALAFGAMNIPAASVNVGRTIRQNNRNLDLTGIYIKSEDAAEVESHTEERIRQEEPEMGEMDRQVTAMAVAKTINGVELTPTEEYHISKSPVAQRILEESAAGTLEVGNNINKLIEDASKSKDEKTSKLANNLKSKLETGQRLSDREVGKLYTYVNKTTEKREATKSRIVKEHKSDTPIETKTNIERQAESKVDVSEARTQVIVPDSLGSNKTATLKSISIEDDGTYVELDNGEKVLADDVNLNKGVKQIIDDFAHYDTELANQAVMSYVEAPQETKEIQSPTTFSRQFSLAVEYARLGRPMEFAVKSGAINTLSETQLQTAYNIGQRLSSVSAKQKFIDDSRVLGQRRTGSFSMEKVNLNRVKRTLSKQGYDNLKKEIRLVTALTQTTGINIELEESSANNNGVFTGANGWMDKNGTIHLDVNALRDTTSDENSMMLYTLSHELTHLAKVYSPQMWKEYSDFMIRVMEENGENIESLIQAKKEEYSAIGQTLTNDQALEEIVAQGSQMCLTNSSLLERMAWENMTMFQKFKEWVLGFIEDIKRTYRTYEKNLGREADAVIDRLDEIAARFEDLQIDAIRAMNETPEKLDGKLKEERDALQVRESKEFIKWFGDWKNDPKNASKVVNEDGTPMVVYHGTEDDFTVFDTSVKGGVNGKAEGFGIYLSPDQDITRRYGDRQMALYANIRYPARYNKKTITQGKLAKLIKKTCENEAAAMVKNGDNDNAKDAVRDTWISNYVYTYDSKFSDINNAYKEVAKNILQLNDNDMEIIQEVMAGMAIRTYDAAMKFYNETLTPVIGIDGFYTQWSNNKTGKKSDVWLAFKPEQIKSATDNIGAFDVNDPDIRYQARDTEYMKAVKDGDMETAQRMVYEAAKRAMPDSKRVGEENAIYIKDGHRANGEVVDFANAILDGVKKGETRTHKSLTRKWVGVAKDGYVIGRVRLGEPIRLTKDMPEYKDSLIEGTEYDIKEGGAQKYYYPVEEIMDLRDNPRPISRNGNYGQYLFKSLDPVTYDDEGNVIPLSQRFSDSSDIRYQARGYMDAVNKGDLDTAQQMVDKAAKDAGYNSPVLYHGTNADEFFEFKPSEYLPEVNGDSRIKGYFSEDESYSEAYGKVKKYYVKLTNPLVFGDNDWQKPLEKWKEWFAKKGITNIKFDSSVTKDPLKGGMYDGTKHYSVFELFDGAEYWMGDGNITERIAAAGYDGIRWNFNEKAWIPFESNQIKSADPVVYDDEGKVIPLSERFSDSSDIRYQARGIVADAASDNGLFLSYKDGKGTLVDFNRELGEAMRSLVKDGSFTEEDFDGYDIYGKDPAGTTYGGWSNGDVIKDGGLYLKDIYENGLFSLSSAPNVAANIALQNMGYTGVAVRSGKDVLTITFEPRQNGPRTEKKPKKKRTVDYNKAVKDGDMESAQDLLTAAAKKAMPNTVVVDEDGNPRVMYHGGRFGQDIFVDYESEDYSPYIWNASDAAEGAGGWFSVSEEYSSYYLPINMKPIKAYINITNPFELGDAFDLIVKDKKYTPLLHDIAQRLNVADKVIFDMIDMDYANDYDERNVPLFAINRTKEFVDLLKKNGYDGAHDIEYDKTDAYMVVDSKQIKSADPVVYDDEGKVIPLSERFSDSADIRYQLRNYEIDERNEFAEAIETYAKTPADKRALNEYRRRLNEYIKLRLYRDSVYDQLSATKQESEKKRLNKSLLDAEKNIRKMDASLFGMESNSQPVKDLLAKHTKEIVKGVKVVERAVREEKVQDEIDKRRAQIARFRENAKDKESKTKLRAHIKKKVKRLDDMLRHATNTRHIPDSLHDAVIQFCEVFTDNTSIFTKTQLDDIRAAYEMMKEGGRLDDIQLAGQYDENIPEMLNDLRETMAGKRLAELTVSELETVKNIIDHFNHIVNNENTIFFKGKRQQVSELAKEAILEARKDGPKKYLFKSGFAKFVGIQNLTPVTFFDNVGPVFKGLFNEMMTAQNDWGRQMEETSKYFEKIAAKYHYYEWSEHTKKREKRKHYDMTTERGDKISLTTEEALGLYATWKREQLDETQRASHLSSGGFVKQDAVKEKRLKGVVTYKVDVKDAHPLTQKDMTHIANKILTDDQKAYADELVRYMSNEMAALGNEASQMMHGYSKFKVKYYYPYKSSDMYLKTKLDSPESTPMIKSVGFSKNLTPNANNPVVARDFTDVFTEHVTQMIYYRYMAPAQDNFMRVYNAKVPEADKKVAVKAEVTTGYGENAHEYILQFMRDIYGGTKMDLTAATMDKAISLFKQNAVMMSASVVIQQPTSLLRAFAMINPKYFAGVGFSKKAYDEMYKHSGIAVIKSMGRFDIYTSRSTSSWLTKRKYDGFEKAKGAMSDADYRNDLMARAPQKADEMAWTMLWNAVKKETLHTTDLKKDSEEFFAHVTKRFNDIVNHTQVYDSVFVRSQNMRSKDPLMKMMTAFMSEPTLYLNMAYNGLKQGHAFKVAGVLIMAVIINDLAKSLVYAGRDSGDDDDDKTYIEKYIAEVVGNFKQDINPVTYVPFLKDIWSVWQGYDIERSDMSIVTDIRDRLKIAIDSDASLADRITALAESVGIITGVPVKNVMRDIDTTINIIFRMPLIEETTPDGVKLAILEELQKDKIIGRFFTFTGDDTYDKMSKALVEGDMETYNKMREKAKWYIQAQHEDEDYDKADTDIDSGLKDSLKAMYDEGEVTENQVEGVLNRLGYDKNDVFFQLEEWEYVKETGESYSKYGEVRRAVESGGSIDSAKKKLTDHGVEEESVDKEVKKHIGTLYKDGKLSKEQTASRLKQYTDMEDGEIYWQMKRYDYIIENGNDKGYSNYTAFDEAIANKDMNAFYEARQEMIDHKWVEQDTDGWIKRSTYTAIKMAYLSGKISYSDAVSMLQGLHGDSYYNANRIAKGW